MNEFFQAIEGDREMISGGGKAQTEVTGDVEAIARSEQYPALGCGLAERARVFAAR